MFLFRNKMENGIISVSLTFSQLTAQIEEDLVLCFIIHQAKKKYIPAKIALLTVLFLLLFFSCPQLLINYGQ